MSLIYFDFYFSFFSIFFFNSFSILFHFFFNLFYCFHILDLFQFFWLTQANFVPASLKRHNPTDIIIQHLPPTWLHIDLWFFIPPESFITVLVINSKMIRAILSSIWIEIHLVHCIIGCPNITPWKKLVTKNAKSTCIVEFQSIIHALLCSGIYVWYYM